jgi:GAF domain-containing protein
MGESSVEIAPRNFEQVLLAENNSVSDNKPFDEQTLAKVLEAAYVLQEHYRAQEQHQSVRRESAVGGPPARTATNPAQPIADVKAEPQKAPARASDKEDFTLVLARIVQTQQRIQAENLEFESAIALIAEHAMQVAQAAGAGIGILENGKLHYRAAVGAMALAVGSEVAMEKALCSACLRVGHVVRCGSVNLEFLVDAEECARRGIESLIAAPIHHSGAVAGALELYYGQPQSFAEPDVHACQLMAGLAGEVLARSEGQASKKSLQAERAAMRDALEKLKPNLEALVEQPAGEILPETVEIAAAPAVEVAAAPAARFESVLSHCSKCGNELLGDEVFCGKCGMPRMGESKTLSMQSKVALLWQMQEQKKRSGIRTPSNGASYPQASAGAFDAFTPEDVCETTMPELGELLASADFAKPLANDNIAGPDHNGAQYLEDGNLALDHNPQPAHEAEYALQAVPSQPAIVKMPPRPNWTSAAAAREFLERVARENKNNAFFRFLKVRRGDIYLALAIILVACVIRWGVWSDKPATHTTVTATHHSVYADLSVFDRMLIKLGLADPPDPPVYKGNPNTQVWVDEQTALYYCPGADLYGKTPKGRMTSQQDAQLDQFEPASRKACN